MRPTSRLPLFAIAALLACSAVGCTGDEDVPEWTLERPAPSDDDRADGTRGQDAAAYVPPGEISTQPLVFDVIELDGDPIYVTHFDFIPGTDEFLATTRDSRVLHYALLGESTVLLGEFDLDVHVEQDCGILALAFDPNFDENRYLYASVCFSLDDFGIVRLTFDEDDYESIPDSSVEIIHVGYEDTERAQHSIGKIGFDPDGNMWAGFGEKGERSFARDPTSPLGSLVRFRPGEDGGFEPPDPPNPSFGGDGVDIVYAYGLRSPWTVTLDSRGRFFVGDVGGNGPESFEEIDMIDAPGLDLGWGKHEGPCPSKCDGYTDPVRYWRRTPISDYELEDPDVAAANARVGWVGLEYAEEKQDRYDGLLSGRVLYGDMCLGFIRGMRVDGDGEVTSDIHLGHRTGMSAWQVGPDGFIYGISYRRCEHSTGEDIPPGRLVRARLNPALD